MAEQVKLQMPSITDVSDCIPEGRRAYITAASALTSTELKATPWDKPYLTRLTSLERAIGVVASYHRAGTMTPPLPDDLGRIVTEMADWADSVEDHDHAFEASVDHQRAAVLAIRAVVDHGSANV